jgi:hypothetical protein
MVNASLITTFNVSGDAGSEFTATMYEDGIEFTIESQYSFDNVLLPMGSTENVLRTSISVNELDECADSGSYFGCTGYNNFVTFLSGTILVRDTTAYVFSGFDLNTRDYVFTFTSQPTQGGTQIEQFYRSFNPILIAKSDVSNSIPTPGTLGLFLLVAGLISVKRMIRLPQ